MLKIILMQAMDSDIIRIDLSNIMMLTSELEVETLFSIGSFVWDVEMNFWMISTHLVHLNLQGVVQNNYILIETFISCFLYSWEGAKFFGIVWFFWPLLLLSIRSRQSGVRLWRDFLIDAKKTSLFISSYTSIPFSLEEMHFYLLQIVIFV